MAIVRRDAVVVMMTTYDKDLDLRSFLEMSLSRLHNFTYQCHNSVQWLLLLSLVESALYLFLELDIAPVVQLGSSSLVIVRDSLTNNPLLNRR